MNRCQRCVMPDTRPDTAFVDGVCSACIAYANRPVIDWGARLRAFEELVDRAKGIARARGLPYDCIVPSSGGKDSHYQVLTLIDHGMRPLVVTAGTCHPTPIGVANIANLARHATTVEYTPNRSVRAKLNRLGLELVGDISWPEHVGIFTIPFLIARRVGVPFLFYGENPQNQYGGPMDTLEAQQMTRRWVSEFGGFLGLRPQDLIGQHGLTEADMADYMLPEGAALGLEAHFIGQYIPWDSHRNAEVARKAGMRQERPAPANLWFHENLDNAQTGLHDYMMFRKYGFGRGCSQISVDVRAGRIQREQALEWVRLNDGAFPYEYAGVKLAEVLERIGLTEPELRTILDQFTNWDLFEHAGYFNVRPKGAWA